MAYEIANVLPDFIDNKIDLQTIKNAEYLLMEVGKHEHLVNKKKTINKTKYTNEKIYGGNERPKPCKICDKLDKRPRCYLETKC